MPASESLSLHAGTALLPVGSAIPLSRVRLFADRIKKPKMISLKTGMVFGSRAIIAKQEANKEGTVFGYRARSPTYEAKRQGLM